MKVAVVAEYYPRAADPALGVWAHRQALATRDAGADVEVFVLHRPVPSKAALRSRDAKQLVRPLLQPLRAELDGLKVTYVPFVAPPRPRSYASWGTWAAPTLALALRNRFDLVHAHYAVPAGDAARRQRAPLVISVHGGDVLGVAERFKGGRAAVTRAFEAARLTLANSAGIAERSRALGAREVRVVHLGTDVPERGPRGTHVVTVGNLIARKRHADVLHALALLPGTRYVVVGDGPERPALERLAAELGVNAEFRGALGPGRPSKPPAAPARSSCPAPRRRSASPTSRRWPAGCPRSAPRASPARRRSRPAAAGCGSSRRTTRPRSAHAIRAALSDDGAAARANVIANFTWKQCGEATLAAYEDALR